MNTHTNTTAPPIRQAATPPSTDPTPRRSRLSKHTHTNTTHTAHSDLYEPPPNLVQAQTPGGTESSQSETHKDLTAAQLNIQYSVRYRYASFILLFSEASFLFCRLFLVCASLCEVHISLTSQGDVSSSSCLETVRIHLRTVLFCVFNCLSEVSSQAMQPVILKHFSHLCLCAIVR